MQATESLEQWFQNADASLPVLTETARAAVVGLGGLLWVAGGRLLKAAAVTGGLMLGMILGGLVMGFVESAMVGLAFMVGLGLLGALGALLIFRFWVAFAAALILAISAPAAVMVWQGTPTQTVAEDAEQVATEIERQYNAGSKRLSAESRLQVQSLIEQGDTESLQEADQILADQGAKELADAKGAVFRNIEDVESWWKSNSTVTHRTLAMAMLIGAGAGFLLGMVLPNYAVAAQSALVGAVLIVIPGRELLASYVPDATGLIPTTARGTLITLGLITAVGMALQWTLHLRRVDKQE